MKKNNISITNTNVWKDLIKHYNEIKNKNIKQLFIENTNRFNYFNINFENIFLDYSKNNITIKTINLLLKLTEISNLSESINNMFNGDKINKTEKRSVLHTALRYNYNYNNSNSSNTKIHEYVNQMLNKMKNFSEKIINKKWKGFSNKEITDVVNVGIGGSYLGPIMVVNALKYYKTNINIHFVSNIDYTNLLNILKKINPETTIFIISSKTFTTQETITNANTIKKWFLKYAILKKYINKHFIAVSNNYKEVQKFGINSDDNIFYFYDWVGGRYSLWGPIGLIICIAIGFNNFQELLNGAHKIDQHFKYTPFNKNIPVILALLGIWYINFFKYNTHAILPYDEYLLNFVPFIQQLDMESNGKNIDTNGNKINYHTSPIIWGGIGTNNQHSFFQLLHQGTSIVPSDFIFTINPLNNINNHHYKLFSNLLAQSKALAFGKEKHEVLQEYNTYHNQYDKNLLIPFQIFEGNRPNNIIFLKKLTPYTLGNLIAIYEHKIFVQGIIWNIFSFDQWGVELGKKLSKIIYQDLLLNTNSIEKYDSSTYELINFYKKNKK